MPEENKKVRVLIGLKIDPEVWDRFKKHCEAHGFIMGARVEWLIKRYLEEFKE